MILPKMKYKDGISRAIQDKFGGLVHKASASDGEIYDMKNLTSRHYPLLSPRSPRRRLTSGGSPRNLTTPNGIWADDKLLWIDGINVYYDGVLRGNVTNSKKVFASLSSRIIIFPDKKVLNVTYVRKGEYVTLAALQAAITSPARGDAYGVGSAVPYRIYAWNGTEWYDNGLELDALESTWTGTSLTFGDGLLYGVTASANKIQCTGVTWSSYFKKGDAITISGCTTVPSNNKTPIIREIDGDKMYFYEDVFTLSNDAEYTETGSMKIARTVPDLDFITSNENRIWGVRGDSIYASKPGDPYNWNVFDSLASDSYQVDSGSAGDFTGITTYNNYPTLFKENRIFKVYGSIASDFEIMGGGPHLGCETGSSASFAVAGNTLFYLSSRGISAYTGGNTASVADAFGTMNFKNAVGGTDGIKYYVSMTDQDNEKHLFVYDTEHNVWHREDSLDVIGFAPCGSALYALDSDGYIWIMGEAEEIPNSASESLVSWICEFGDYLDGTSDKKALSRIVVRLDVPSGSNVTAQIKYDSTGDWQTVATITTAITKDTKIMTIIPHRCDHYKLKFTGTGPCFIYSITREFYTGSDTKTK